MGESRMLHRSSHDGWFIWKNLLSCPSPFLHFLTCVVSYCRYRVAEIEWFQDVSLPEGSQERKDVKTDYLLELLLLLLLVVLKHHKSSSLWKQGQEEKVTSITCYLCKKNLPFIKLRHMLQSTITKMYELENTIHVRMTCGARAIHHWPIDWYFPPKWSSQWYLDYQNPVQRFTTKNSMFWKTRLSCLYKTDLHLGHVREGKRGAASCMRGQFTALFLHTVKLHALATTQPKVRSDGQRRAIYFNTLPHV
jgi:hypothetical protein